MTTTEQSTPRKLPELPGEIESRGLYGDGWNAYRGYAMQTTEALQSALAESEARAEGDARNAARWRHLRDEMTRSYGDGQTEPVEYFVSLSWQQGSWIWDGSNDGRGKPDTFPGWDSIVDEMIAKTAAERDDDTAIAQEAERG